MAMKPTKPRVWTEDETRLLMELAHLKKSAPVIAKQLGRYTASVRRRASIGLPSAAKQRWTTALNLEGTAILIGASCARGHSDRIWVRRKVTSRAPTSSWSRHRGKSLETPKILL